MHQPMHQPSTKCTCSSCTCDVLPSPNNIHAAFTDYIEFEHSDGDGGGGSDEGSPLFGHTGGMATSSGAATSGHDRSLLRLLRDFWKV